MGKKNGSQVKEHGRKYWPFKILYTYSFKGKIKQDVHKRLPMLIGKRGLLKADPVSNRVRSDHFTKQPDLLSADSPPSPGFTLSWVILSNNA